MAIPINIEDLLNKQKIESNEGCGDTVILNVPQDVTHDVPHKLGSELGSRLGSELGSEYAELTETRRKILSMIREDNQISIAQMAEKLGLSTTAVEKNLTYLKTNGYLIREGRTSSGYWKIKTSDKNKR